MKAEYKRLFGMSNPVRGVSIGDNDVTFAKDMSTLCIAGKGGRLYWIKFTMYLIFRALQKTMLKS